MCEVSTVVPISPPGRHTLSGACVEPTALNELFPDWKEMGVGIIFFWFYVSVVVVFAGDGCLMLFHDNIIYLFCATGTINVI